MVVSVNPQKPLRPWIMLYDAKVPKEEATVLDLERHEELQIVKALRPALLLRAARQRARGRLLR